MPAADAGEQFPQRVEHLPGGFARGLRVLRPDFLREQRALDRSVLAVGFDVDGEVAEAVLVGEAVVLLQPVNFRLRDGRDLALVGIERGERGTGVAFAANLPEGRDERARFRPDRGFSSSLGESPSALANCRQSAG